MVGELEQRCQGQPYSRVQGWVSNIHEWMAAADLLLSKPGASTVNEAINAGLPLVAFGPLPGNAASSLRLHREMAGGLLGAPH